MTIPLDVNATPATDRASGADLRAEMYRILDEIGTARSDRAAALKKEFDALWKQTGGEEATRH
jgi:hypothetical protein